MLLLVAIDLSRADMRLFEAYEAQVLALLPDHGARLIERLRSRDGTTETHLLAFPDPDALARFRTNPARIAMQTLWDRCGATSVMVEVDRIGG